MHHRFTEGLLACVLACAGAAHAASLDEEKLRMLSCEKGAASAKVAAWLAQFNAGGQDDGLSIPGPLMLGKACLRHVSVTGSFGVQVVQGEICNARLDEFTDALAAAGTRLGKQIARKAPGFVLGMEEGDRSYVIADRLVDMKTGKPVPMDGKYAFTCTVSEGGPQ